MLDAALVQQPKAPQAPQPPTVPGVPRTREELEALIAKRSELADQLESVTDRREEVADQHSEADAAARPGLESRLETLDERSAWLEQEIVRADDAIAAGLAGGIVAEPGREAPTTVQPFGDFVRGDVMARAMLFEALAFVLLGVVLYRRMRKRAQAMGSRETPDESSRLDQLQHSIDAIAVEVERISEGQRYVTKMLNDGWQPAVGAGAGQQVLANRKAP